jgi:hypothetical protein
MRHFETFETFETYETFETFETFETSETKPATARARLDHILFSLERIFN